MRNGNWKIKLKMLYLGQKTHRQNITRLEIIILGVLKISWWNCNFMMEFLFHHEIIISSWNCNFIMKFEFLRRNLYVNIRRNLISSWNSNFMMKFIFHHEIDISTWNCNVLMKFRIRADIAVSRFNINSFIG